MNPPHTTALDTTTLAANGAWTRSQIERERHTHTRTDVHDSGRAVRVCHGHPRSSYLFADSRDRTLAEERSSVLRAACDGIACDHVEPVATESLHQTSRLFNLHINASSTHVHVRMCTA
jgi:hypothetical protein